MTNIKLTITHVTGLKQGERETFTSLPITIGRALDSQLRLAANDTRASTRHAELILEDGHIILRDLNATNGTYLNGRRVERTRLISGDIAEFGTDGPQLRFDFEINEPANINTKADVGAVTPAIRPLQPASGPPPLAMQPGNANRPQFGIANEGGRELAVGPPAPMPAVAPLAPVMAIEEREFPFKNRLKYLLFGGGFLLVLMAGALFFYKILIWSVPAALIGLFLVTMGWSYSRINITANSEGIHYQGILRSIQIKWDEVTELKVFRSRTRLLSDLVYVVHSRNRTIVFAAEDYQDGLELANLIARRTNRSW